VVPATTPSSSASAAYSWPRAHYVKARVKVRQYPDSTLAVFHGPRLLTRYDADGRYLAQNLKCAA
jgi:hypothetical protein